jgi:hypothetical protein
MVYAHAFDNLFSRMNTFSQQQKNTIKWQREMTRKGIIRILRFGKQNALFGNKFRLIGLNLDPCVDEFFPRSF